MSDFNESALLQEVANLNTELTKLRSTNSELTEQLAVSNQKLVTWKTKFSQLVEENLMYSRFSEIHSELFESAYSNLDVNECFTLFQTLLLETGCVKDAIICYRNTPGVYGNEIPLPVYLNTRLTTSESWGVSYDLLDKLDKSFTFTLTRCARKYKSFFTDYSTTDVYTMIGKYKLYSKPVTEPAFAMILRVTPTITKVQLNLLEDLANNFSYSIGHKRQLLSIFTSHTTLKNKCKHYEAKIATNTLTGAKSIESLKIYMSTRDMSKPIIMAFMDIDKFKLVNDTFGHQNGDNVLKWFAQTLTTACDCVGGDVYHISGDEFICTFECSDLTLIAETLESFQQVCRRKVFHFSTIDTTGELNHILDHNGNEEQTTHLTHEKSHSVTCSIGLFLDNESLPLEEIKSIADKAMYHSKKQGRDKISILTKEISENTTCYVAKIWETDK